MRKKSDLEHERAGALQIFTYKVVQQACDEENPVAIEWGNYPELAEDDWFEIVARVKQQTNYGPGTQGMYDRAYKFLTERANRASEE